MRPGDAGKSVKVHPQCSSSNTVFWHCKSFAGRNNFLSGSRLRNKCGINPRFFQSFQTASHITKNPVEIFCRGNLGIIPLLLFFRGRSNNLPIRGLACPYNIFDSHQPSYSVAGTTNGAESKPPDAAAPSKPKCTASSFCIRNGEVPKPPASGCPWKPKYFICFFT